MSDPLYLEVLHEVPGRLRARSPGLRDVEPQRAELERIASELPGLEGLELRTRTESVVFRYSLEETTPEAFRAALGARCTLTEPMLAPSVPGAQPPGAVVPIGGRLIHGVRRQWRQADRAVYQATGGIVDLRTTVPWVLVFLALRQIATSRYLPALPWYTALYYSLQAITRYPEAPGEPPSAPPPPDNGAD